MSDYRRVDTEGSIQAVLTMQCRWSSHVSNCRIVDDPRRRKLEPRRRCANFIASSPSSPETTSTRIQRVVPLQFIGTEKGEVKLDKD